MHRTTREGDEMVCSCGLRWATDEADPHVEVDPFNPNHFAELELNHVEDNKDWK